MRSKGLLIVSPVPSVPGLPRAAFQAAAQSRQIHSERRPAQCLIYTSVSTLPGPRLALGTRRGMRAGCSGCWRSRAYTSGAETHGILEKLSRTARSQCLGSGKAFLFENSAGSCRTPALLTLRTVLTSIDRAELTVKDWFLTSGELDQGAPEKERLRWSLRWIGRGDLVRAARWLGGYSVLGLCE
jgi:hypothetical protein